MSVPVSRSALFAAHVAAQPGNAMFRFSLGQALLNEGDSAGAVEHLRLAAQSRGDWMLPRILLGKALAATGDASGARESFEAALALAISQGHEEPESELRLLLAAAP